MNIKVLAGSGAALGLLGLGILAGSVVGAGGASAQTTAALSSSGANAQVSQVRVSYSDIAGAPAAQAAATAVPSQSVPAQPGPKSTTPIQAALTQAQAEQAALAASPGNTIDHTSLQDQNGTAVYDVDFTNGGGVVVDANTGAIIATEAAGTDKGGNRGPGGGRGGRGGHDGGADQATLAAKATVTQQQAEQTALTTSPSNTIDHSRLGQDASGTIFWDVDFTNGGGVVVNAQTGAVISTEAAGTDHGGRPQAPAATQP